MSEWLKNIRETGQLQNAAGLSDEALQLLRDDFVRLEPLKKDLPDRVLRYAVDGVGEEVLGELRGEPKANHLLDLALTPSISDLIITCVPCSSARRNQRISPSFSGWVRSISRLPGKIPLIPFIRSTIGCRRY